MFRLTEKVCNSLPIQAYLCVLKASPSFRSINYIRTRGVLYAVKEENTITGTNVK